MKLGLVSVHCVASALWTLQSEPVCGFRDAPVWL